MSKDLLLAKQLSSKDLTEEEAESFIKKVGEMIAITSDKVEMLGADLYTKQAALREALDTTGNSSLDDASILAINTSPIQTSVGPAKTASVSAVPVTQASTSAASARNEPFSAVPNPTTCSNSIPTITPILVKPKAAASTLAASNKVVRFTQDAAKKKGDEWKNEVSVSTTTEEFDKDSEGSYTTIAEVVENQKVIEEDVKDNQEAINDDQDVVIENA